MSARPRPIPCPPRSSRSSVPGGKTLTPQRSPPHVRKSGALKYNLSCPKPMPDSVGTHLTTHLVSTTHALLVSRMPRPSRVFLHGGTAIGRGGGAALLSTRRQGPYIAYKSTDVCVRVYMFVCACAFAFACARACVCRERGRNRGREEIDRERETGRGRERGTE